MHIRCSALALSVRAGILVLLVLTALRGQADSSLFDHAVAAAPPPARPAAASPAVQALYRKHCAKCHGADGKGSAAKALFAEIPDFTSSHWHARRSDGQLLVSILDGKGTGMPSLAGKITKSEARDLLGYVRAFAPAPKKAGHEQKKKSAADSFDDRYRALHKELAELQKQFRRLSEASADSNDP